MDLGGDGGLGFDGRGERGRGECSAGREAGGEIWGLSARALLEKVKFGGATFSLYMTDMMKWVSFLGTCRWR